MNRPASPLLHDYKHSAASKPAKPKALKWFAVGLGIPLVGVDHIEAHVVAAMADAPDLGPPFVALVVAS